MEESEFLRHDFCPTCGSSDGLAVYTDEHTFCFVCHTWTAGPDDIKTPIRTRVTITYKGSASRLDKRGISEKTCERYKIYRDGNKLRFYYHNKNGQPIGSKIRDADKKF